MNYLVRLCIIILGFLASCAVGGLLISTAWATQENAIDGGTVYRIFARAIAFGGFAAAASLLVIPVIGYAEYAAERRFAFYAICGALAGSVPALITVPDSLTSKQGLTGFALFAAVGLVAGAVYWLIAGRSAGFPKSATGRIDLLVLRLRGKEWSGGMPRRGVDRPPCAALNRV